MATGLAYLSANVPRRALLAVRVEADEGHQTSVAANYKWTDFWAAFFFRSLLPLSPVKMPVPADPHTHAHTLPPRRLYQRKGVREIDQYNDKDHKDRIGESNQPKNRFPDMTSRQSLNSPHDS